MPAHDAIVPRFAAHGTPRGVVGLNSGIIQILSAGAGHLLFALPPISGVHGGLAAETPCRRRPIGGSPPTIGRLIGSEARCTMRQDWTRLNRVGENAAFWMTVLTVAIAGGMSLLVYAISPTTQAAAPESDTAEALTRLRKMKSSIPSAQAPTPKSIEPTAAPKPIEPTAQAATPKSIEANTPEQIRQRGADWLKQCLQDWDAETHMTKRDWQRVCRRVSEERVNELLKQAKTSPSLKR